MATTKTITALKKYARFLLLLLLVSCSRTAQRRDQYITSYRHGDLEGARVRVEELLDEKLPQASYEHCGDAPWLLLDSGMLAFAQNDMQTAVDTFRHAVEAIDFYQQTAHGEQVGQLLLDDRIRAYAADDYEEVLARLYLAWALYATGDESNAYAVLRQAEERQAQLERIYPLAKLFFGLALQQKGDRSNAAILFDQAGLSAPAERPLLVVVEHNGAVPLKDSVMLPGSDIVGWLVEDILVAAGQQQFSLSSLTGVPIPQLALGSGTAPHNVRLLLDDQNVRTEPICDITGYALEELAEQQPKIAARAAARAIIRRGTVAAVDNADKGAGQLADLLALFANIATQADTRSWGTLPARIDVALVPVNPGRHRFSVRNAWQRSQSWDLDIRNGDVHIIHLFTQGERQPIAHIPQNILASQEEAHETTY